MDLAWSLCPRAPVHRVKLIKFRFSKLCSCDRRKGVRKQPLLMARD